MSVMLLENPAAQLAQGRRVRIHLEVPCYVHDRPDAAPRHPLAADGQTGTITAVLGGDVVFSAHRYGVVFDRHLPTATDGSSLARGGVFAARELESLAIGWSRGRRRAGEPEDDASIVVPARPDQLAATVVALLRDEAGELPRPEVAVGADHLRLGRVVRLQDHHLCPHAAQQVPRAARTPPPTSGSGGTRSAPAPRRRPPGPPRRRCPPAASRNGAPRQRAAASGSRNPARCAPPPDTRIPAPRSDGRSSPSWPRYPGCGHQGAGAGESARSAARSARPGCWPGPGAGPADTACRLFRPRAYSSACRLSAAHSRARAATSTGIHSMPASRARTSCASPCSAISAPSRPIRTTAFASAASAVAGASDSIGTTLRSQSPPSAAVGRCFGGTRRPADPDRDDTRRIDANDARHTRLARVEQAAQGGAPLPDIQVCRRVLDASQGLRWSRAMARSRARNRAAVPVRATPMRSSSRQPPRPTACSNRKCPPRKA